MKCVCVCMLRTNDPNERIRRAPTGPVAHEPTNSIVFSMCIYIYMLPIVILKSSNRLLFHSLYFFLTLFPGFFFFILFYFSLLLFIFHSTIVMIIHNICNKSVRCFFLQLNFRGPPSASCNYIFEN